MAGVPFAFKKKNNSVFSCEHMIQTREWQTGSDYSEIKELDQVL